MLDIEPFTRSEAVAVWGRLVAGWADHLDPEGARTHFDGVQNEADQGGSFEGVTRMLWGLGGWLSQPGRPAVVRWQGQDLDLEALMRRSIVHGCDPRSPSYWLKRPLRQLTVESGQVGYTLWQTRLRIWETLSEQQQGHVIGFLARTGVRPRAWRNNWALFWVLNHAFRKSVGAPHDQGLIEEVIGDYLDRAYAGDGWYDDGPAVGHCHYDDYNYWVFSTHEMAWADMDGHNWPERRDELFRRIRLRMAHYPCFFAADGAYAEYGRSLTYKFARLGAPLMAYRHGLWPHSTGMLKRLVGRHLRWYLDRGAIRADGTLRQSLTRAGSLGIRERYISTGAPYWGMLLFAGLWSLPDDDPFWSIEEEPLPAERGDQRQVFPQPGWVVVAKDGHVQRFNAKSDGRNRGGFPGYVHKYNKYVYATLHPWNVGLDGGQPSPDSVLCLTDGVRRGHRVRNLVAEVGEPGWLRMIYEQSIGGGRHRIDTVLVPLGSLHLRAHRLTLDPRMANPIGALEGSAPLGFGLDQTPRLEAGEGWQLAWVEGRATGIRAIRGYERAGLWQGDPSINIVHPTYQVPVLRASTLAPDQELVCLAYMGSAAERQALLTAQVRRAAWLDDGTFEVRVDGMGNVVVPPLALVPSAGVRERPGSALQ